MNEIFAKEGVVKVHIDAEEAWQDTVTFYKSHRLDITKQLRVQLNHKPALDTGGERAQLYSTVFEEFAKNEYANLFEGPPHHLRPRCMAEARSSGLFKVLSSMVAHSLALDGIGFPYLSPTCYWYIVDGEDRAIEYISIADVGADVAILVSKVNIGDMPHIPYLLIITPSPFEM